MKILHLCLASFYIDNYSYQENMLPKFHKKMGLEVEIIASLVSFDKNGKISFLKSAGSYINEYGIPVTRLDYKKRIFSTRTRQYEGTFEAIEKAKPDIIFIHGCQFVDIKQVNVYVEQNPNVRVYIDNHADYINSATNFISKYFLHKVLWRGCISKLLPRCEKIYGVTPNRCDFLNEMYNVPKNMIELLVMGVDDEKIKINTKDEIRRVIRNKLMIAEDDFVLITGGKIDEKKNIHNLIMAVNKLANPKIKLIIFGTVNNDMKDKIKELSATPSIKNIGWINSNDIYDYFLASDLAVFPGTHSVLWEQAVGSGLPCIFKKWHGMTHVDIGGNCIFINEGNIAEILSTINEIFNNKEKYEKMRSIAVEKGIGIFSYSEIARRAIG